MKVLKVCPSTFISEESHYKLSSIILHVNENSHFYINNLPTPHPSGNSNLAS